MEGKVKIGLFGIGPDTYWSQFDGLLDKLESFQLRIRDRLVQSGTEVVDAGPSHHCATGVGHLSSKISKLSELYNLGFLWIC